MPCFNLDAWAMRPELLEALVRRLGRVSELILCEGAMGLFDGLGATEIGSTAELAERLRWAGVLAGDAPGPGGPGAALLQGFFPDPAPVPAAGAVFYPAGGAPPRALVPEA